MQLHHLDKAQLAETLEQSTLLAQLEGPGPVTTYVLEFDKQDILILAPNTSNWATVIYPCASFDHEDGSIHDNARQALGVDHAARAG
ncbi:MAG: hypothetical protein RLZZ401_28 [Pseudomonadota bacterium]|jgi:hypothetical protein